MKANCLKYILNIWNWKCRSGLRRRKTGLTLFDRKYSDVLGWIFHKFNYPTTYEKERISHILNIWNRKCRSKSWKRKAELMAINRKYLSVYCWIFHNFSTPATYENELISHILNIWNRNCRSRSRMDEKAELMPFDCKWLNLHCWFFYNSSCLQHTNTNDFRIFKTF